MCKYSIAVHPDNEDVKNSAMAWTNEFGEIPNILKKFHSET
jgi:hypothetical protein